MRDKRSALRDLGHRPGLFKDNVQHMHQHHLMLEHAARDLDDKLALLISRRAEEHGKAQKVEGAQVVEMPA
jgi:hypothetical protein